MTMLVSWMSTRCQLPHHLRKNGLKAPIVEIGVHRGEFADVLIRGCPNAYHGIDPWELAEDYDGEQVERLRTESRENDYLVAEQRVMDANTSRCLEYDSSCRVSLTKAHSLDEVDEYVKGSLSLVYVDGNHRMRHVLNDLIAWWPKLQSGGILAGHDFVCPGEEEGGWGAEIQPAVHLFARMKGLDVYLIVEEEGMPWTYYFIKP